MAQHTERQPDGSYKTYSEQEWKEKNAGLGWITGLGAVAFVLWLIYITLINVGSLATISRYGVELYYKNIIHFHSDGYIETKKIFFYFQKKLRLQMPRAVREPPKQFTLASFYAQRDTLVAMVHLGLQLKDTRMTRSLEVGSGGQEKKKMEGGHGMK